VPSAITVSPPKKEALAPIACPVIGFYGGEDHRITQGVPEVAAAMKKLGKTYDYTVYPDAGHAFFNDTRASYAPDAWAKTLMLFDNVLPPLHHPNIPQELDSSSCPQEAGEVSNSTCMTCSCVMLPKYSDRGSACRIGVSAAI
jgi:hypothetical protein